MPLSETKSQNPCFYNQKPSFHSKLDLKCNSVLNSSKNISFSTTNRSWMLPIFELIQEIGIYFLPTKIISSQ